MVGSGFTVILKEEKRVVTSKMKGSHRLIGRSEQVKTLQLKSLPDMAPCWSGKCCSHFEESSWRSFHFKNLYFMKHKVSTKLSKLCFSFLFWCYVYLNVFVIMSFTECPLNIVTSSEVTLPFYFHMSKALCLEVRCTEWLLSITGAIVHIICNVCITFVHIHSCLFFKKQSFIYSSDGAP
jgi:hypothetical protein